MKVIRQAWFTLCQCIKMLIKNIISFQSVRCNILRSKLYTFNFFLSKAVRGQWLKISYELGIQPGLYFKTERSPSTNQNITGLIWKGYNKPGKKTNILLTRLFEYFIFHHLFSFSWRQLSTVWKVILSTSLTQDPSGGHNTLITTRSLELPIGFLPFLPKGKDTWRWQIRLMYTFLPRFGIPSACLCSNRPYEFTVVFLD